MKFTTMLLDYEGTRAAKIDDFKCIPEMHSYIYQPPGQKNLYEIDTEILHDRFFWVSCEYDDAVRFRDYVINSETGERQPNPRNQKQIEPRQQFFACYDEQNLRLYLSSMNIKSIFQRFLSDTFQKEFQIRNIYTSVEDFCTKIKTIRGFRFTQVNNIFSRENEIFKVVTDFGGLDVPNKLQIRVDYGDTPLHKGRALIDKLHHKQDEFEKIVIIGADDCGIEQTFDFSSVTANIELSVQKDATEHYDPAEVKTLLLARLR